ncbi:MAG: hypothetical protein GF331_19745 [Chitinivibrionales bacterium]|nr:hypothetical protein [Chitinivibrionales bacterium]
MRRTQRAMLRKNCRGFRSLFCCSVLAAMSITGGVQANDVVYRAQRVSFDIDSVGPYIGVQIEVPAKATYFLTVWADGLTGQKAVVYLGGDSSPVALLNLRADGFQAIQACDVRAPEQAWSALLDKGVHLFKFRSALTEIVQVSEMALSQNQTAVCFDEKAYHRYIDSLKWTVLPGNWSEVREGLAFAESETGGSEMQGRTSWPKDYAFAAGPFTFTYIRGDYYQEATEITIETRNSTTDPILCFFNRYNQSAGYSWADDNGGSGNNASITATIPETGWYITFVFSYSAMYAGYCDLYRNSSLLSYQVPVHGTRYDCSGTGNSGEVNYFTCQTSTGGNPAVWCATSGHVVRGWNDYAPQDGVWDWGNDARVRLDDDNVVQVILSARAYNQTGSTELYMKNEMYLAGFYPELDRDDAIQTDEGTSGYRCFNWAGGDSEPDLMWVDPHSFGSPWYESGDQLLSYDNYFANQCGSGYGGNPDNCIRYEGAWNYTRAGATPTNATIDMWYNEDAQGLGPAYTHASVRKPGNGHPHGYDFESKLGSGARILHPRNALEDDTQWGYGHVEDHYRHDGTYANMSFVPGSTGGLTLEQSLAEGRSVLAKSVQLSQSEQLLLEEWKHSVAQQTVMEFQRLCALWETSCADPKLAKHSTVRALISTEAYRELEAFCVVNRDKTWPLLLDKAREHGILLIPLMVAVSGSEGEKQMHDIVQEWIDNPLDHEGRFVVYNPANTVVRFVKAEIAHWTR